ESSTEFTVTGLSWTAAELGLATIYDGTGISDAARQAVAEQIDLDLLLTALTADHPYDLYWYDKTKYTSSSYSYSNSGETLTITSLKYSFPVLAEYAVAGQSYAVDTSIPQAVQTAKTTAQNIVKKYAGKTDREKLNGYRQEICDRVQYNDAALSDDYSNGNPWQLIWVFDEDPSTDVVCEGYSKAFQYLCDLTCFYSSQIRCITVTGSMDGGAHMWNVVRMEDDKNYLVDVTNCDGSSVGAPDKLFLAKCTEGNVAEGYTFNCGFAKVWYTYDSSIARLYAQSALTIANVDAALDPTPDTATPTPTPTATPAPTATPTPEPATIKKVQAKKSLKLQAPKAKGNAYQWYVRTSKNAPWQSMGKKGAKQKLSVKATMAMDGYQYRCRVTSPTGAVSYTDIYELYVYEQLKVKKQPKWGKASLPGAKMPLTITAQGASSYQWVTRPNGSSPWTKIEGATGTSYVVDVQEGMAGRQYACQISGKAGTAQSKAAVVKIAPWPKVKITRQPQWKKPV
ncbi:MAG: hypothetical protein IJH59_05965, partial [Firmicutes bacterium]|nr:hypothetical protein [Bacillota bacterium]